MFNRFFIVFSSILLLSCAKDDSTQETNQMVSGEAKLADGHETFCMEAYIPEIDMWTLDCKCLTNGGNCVGSFSANPLYHDDFIDAANNGTLDDYFKNDYKNLFSAWSGINDYLPGLRDGTLTVTLFDNIIDKENYVAIHRTSDTITVSNISTKALAVITFDVN
ncbi:MAG: hypothetical protein WBG42_13515 [Cryomorphaceae bacterium]